MFGSISQSWVHASGKGQTRPFDLAKLMTVSTVGCSDTADWTIGACAGGQHSLTGCALRSAVAVIAAIVTNRTVLAGD